MTEFSLVPVDQQPDFSDVSLVPVDHDPFSAEAATQPPRFQLAQTQAQPAQPQPQSLPQQPATGVGQPNVGAPAVSAQTTAPVQPDSYPPGYPTASSPYGPSIINAVRGMFNPSLDEDKKIVSGIYDAAKDALLAPGRLTQPNPYPAGSEEASWYDDQRQKAMVPAAANIAMMFAGLGLPTAERGAVGAFGGKLPPPTSAASVAEKLDRYLLNPDHIDGGPKANWFKQALGFTKENAADLATQLVFDESQAVRRGVSQYGTHFNQTFNVIGANGRTVPVTTGWTIGSDGVPRLTTAFPGR